MPLMNEAMSKEDWERMDKGLPPIPKIPIVKPDPVLPKVDDEIKFEDIPMNRFQNLLSAKRETVKNNEGMRFIGYRVEIKFARPVGRPPKEQPKEEVEKEETISGWMPEGEFHKFYRAIRKKIDRDVVVW